MIPADARWQTALFLAVLVLVLAQFVLDVVRRWPM